MNFIIENWSSILVGIIALSYVGYLIVVKDWVTLKSIAYALMLDAERNYKNNQGSVKRDAVIQALLNEKMPYWLKRFLSTGNVSKYLDEWYQEFRNTLK